MLLCFLPHCHANIRCVRKPSRKVGTSRVHPDTRHETDIPDSWHVKVGEKVGSMILDFDAHRRYLFFSLIMLLLIWQTIDWIDEASQIDLDIAQVQLVDSVVAATALHKRKRQASGANNKKNKKRKLLHQKIQIIKSLLIKEPIPKLKEWYNWIMHPFECSDRQFKCIFRMNKATFN